MTDLYICDHAGMYAICSNCLHSKKHEIDHDEVCLCTTEASCFTMENVVVRVKCIPYNGDNE